MALTITETIAAARAAQEQVKTMVAAAAAASASGDPATAGAIGQQAAAANRLANDLVVRGASASPAQRADEAAAMVRPSFWRAWGPWLGAGAALGLGALYLRGRRRRGRRR